MKATWTKAVNIKSLNKAIHAKYPHVKLRRGKGYYYIYSDDEATADKIAALYTTSIYVYRLNHLSMDQWMSEVDTLMEGKEPSNPGMWQVGEI